MRDNALLAGLSNLKTDLVMKNSVLSDFQAGDGLGVIVRSKQHRDGSQVLSWLGLRERHAADVSNFPGL